MKPRLISTARLSFPLASAIAALLAAPAASALDYYWDSNGSTIGFGTAGAASGTWLAPTPGPSEGWTTDSNGLVAIDSVTATTATAAINVGTLVITGATQATNAITFGGGVLGLDTATTVTAASATVDFTGQQVLVNGPTGAPSYTLLTASSITGTAPTLAAPAPSGYELQVVGNPTPARSNRRWHRLRHLGRCQGPDWSEQRQNRRSGQ